MRSKEWYNKNKWRLSKSLPEKRSGTYLIQELEESEWSKEFEQLMRNRLIMGALRYGKLNVPNKPKYDRCESISKRLVKYQKSGNKEFLVDIANLCLLEFEECHHPKAHFNSIDDGEHVKII